MAPESLERIRAAVDRGETVWNYDVVPGSRDLRALFWTGITKVWWRDYFRTRRPIAFGVDDFDRYPKGTGAFLAPRTCCATAAGEFESHFADASLASDDTRLLRTVAAAEDIHLSPEVLCTHHAKSGRGRGRASATTAARRSSTATSPTARGRGGCWRRAAVAVVGGVAAATLPRTTAAAGVLGCLAAGAGARWCGATPRESVAVGLLSPAFGVMFGAGVVRGLRMAAGSS